MEINVNQINNKPAFAAFLHLYRWLTYLKMGQNIPGILYFQTGKSERILQSAFGVNPESEVLPRMFNDTFVR